VFRIHDILEWIRIRGSMPLINGSGSGSWIRILLFSSLTFKMPTKKNFSLNIFSAYYFVKAHLHNFLTIKSQIESQNSRNQGFSYYFCMMTEGSGSGSIPLTDGSGSGTRRPKNMWIRWIRIRNTGLNHLLVFRIRTRLLHMCPDLGTHKLGLRTLLFSKNIGHNCLVPH
jgi:hypothetical protein